jgi:ornithine cyclodeaminase/alanine dehydrogenase-like protein (mu-crystallin family)
MSTLHLTEDDVRSCLTMPAAIAAVEEVSRQQAAGTVVIHPRRRFEFAGGSFFHHMAAADYAAGMVGVKQYTFVRGKLQFLVSLYDMASGNLVALIAADAMGQLRTGAASGVATKYLAREDASQAAIIGTGGQARTQLEAIACVRRLKSVKAFGRNAARREAFCVEMTKRIGVPVQPANSAADALRGAEIICSATTAGQPVICGADLSDGVHINAIGANRAHKRELDEAAVAKAGAIFVDSVEQSHEEAGDLVLGFESSPGRWDDVRELAQLVAGDIPGRTSGRQITLFKSNGIASWDLAAAKVVYAQARKKQLGRELPLGA